MRLLSEETHKWFRDEMQMIAELDRDEKSKLLRELGLLSKDGRLTTRFGGDGEVDYEAIEAHRQEVERLHAG